MLLTTDELSETAEDCRFCPTELVIQDVYKVEKLQLRRKKKKLRANVAEFQHVYLSASIKLTDNREMFRALVR
jgi:hypothetical protein